ncbi:MAG: sulfotransferase family protein [Nocardiopsaceae bacterium]|nr:sulfotransferase family protein [Nocardiopsaceae bacterium]
MKLIGAGLPRTATMTQKTALEMLGIGPCYHMINIINDLDLVPLWLDALDGRPDWDTIFDGYEACVDHPASFFYRELLEAYPDAKVLLSVRDGEKWARSVRATIWDSQYGDTVTRYLREARRRIDPQMARHSELMRRLFQQSGMFGDDPEHFDEAETAAWMERHNEEVRKYVPPGQLLEWSPSDGWEPLCEFLGKPVPAEPLPHVNETSDFAMRTVGASLDILNQWYRDSVAAAARC